MNSSQINADGPIAVFDSGVGGVSVLRELIKIMPGEDYLYFGDSANAPYGIKNLDVVRELTCAHAAALFERGAKGLVVACNTATSAAVRVLREMYPDVPIVGIEPAVKPAVLSGDHPRVLVMATPMTIREEKFKDLVSRYADKGEIIPLPCPGLMDFIERGDLDGDDLIRYLMELLCDFRDGKVDAAVLGCTHYPFAKTPIQVLLGEGVKIFDGGEGTAREMHRRLSEAGLLRPDSSLNAPKGNVRFENSSDDPGRIATCWRLLAMEP
ncbi:MAG: glutamate racemase [Clostridiales bacterium]|nr:glutamate racemase [Clostridiales bacterium]